MVEALIFDVDGTLAETEELHRRSFNEAFRRFRLPWTWGHAQYKDLLTTTGGRERIERHATQMGVAVDARAIHALKTRIYNEVIMFGSVELRPGVQTLVDNARNRGIRLAIGTTTSRPNVLSLLDATFGPGSAALFDSIRTGEDVAAKKPHPEVYHLVLQDLGLPAESCVCFEDSRNGLMAAVAAGMRTIVTPSIYTADDDFSGASLIIRNLSEPWSSAAFRPYTSLLDQPHALYRLLMDVGPKREPEWSADTGMP